MFRISSGWMAAASVRQEKQRLAHILSQPAFQKDHQQHHSMLRELLQPIFGWIRSRLGAFLHWLSHLFPQVTVSNRAMTIIFDSLAGALAAALLVWVIWLLLKIARHRHIALDQGLRIAAQSKSYVDYQEMAKRALEQKDGKEAVRCGFLCLLYYMSQRRWIHIEKWKTNLEYQEEIAKEKQDWLELFQSASILFDRVWYGNESVNMQESQEYMEHILAGIGKEEGHAAKV